MLNVSFQFPIRFNRGLNIPAFIDDLSVELEQIRLELLTQDGRIAELESAAVQPIDFLSTSPTVCEQCKLPLGTEPTMEDTMGQTYHRECAEKLIQMHGGTT